MASSCSRLPRINHFKRSSGTVWRRRPEEQLIAPPRGFHRGRVDVWPALGKNPRRDEALACTRPGNFKNARCTRNYGGSSLFLPRTLGEDPSKGWLFTTPNWINGNLLRSPEPHSVAGTDDLWRARHARGVCRTCVLRCRAGLSQTRAATYSALHGHASGCDDSISTLRHWFGGRSTNT